MFDFMFLMSEKKKWGLTSVNTLYKGFPKLKIAKVFQILNQPS